MLLEIRQDILVIRLFFDVFNLVHFLILLSPHLKSLRDLAQILSLLSNLLVKILNYALFLVSVIEFLELLRLILLDLEIQAICYSQEVRSEVDVS